MTAIGLLRRSFVTVGLGIAIAGCSDDIVYRDLPDFETPPSGALGFLGYSNSETKRTACGNCHSGKQAEWRQTAHASAWKDLGTSATNKDCQVCHSVGDRGNATTDATAGYASTQNARYQDVQCESCHGPGLAHATNPDVGAKPLASIAVGTALQNGCGECHSGAHQPFVEQWASSRHARVSAGRDSRAECQSCHEVRGVLAAWGIRTNYTEATQAGAPYYAIACVTCHDPHEAANPKQLRFPIDVADLEKNLCMKCHYRRAAPEVASSSGPHSPQGPLLLGDAGWVPPNFAYPPKSLVGSHGSDRNPKLCAGCHVTGYTIPAQGGMPEFRATGHNFQAIPCVDASGIPNGATTCDDSQRSFRACTVCHATEGAARAARAVAAARLTRLADELDTLLVRVPATEFSSTDNRISTAEGARFNMRLARDRGAPVHNPYLIEALLLASARQVKTDYGVSLPPGFQVSSPRPQLKPPPTLSGQ